MKVSILDGKWATFMCPGCKDTHTISITDGRWKFNGSLEKPTFQPSIHVTSGHYAKGHKQGEPCWCTYNAEHPEDPSKFSCESCHSFVTDGRIQFLGDCSHALAGQTVDLPDLEGARA